MQRMLGMLDAGKRAIRKAYQESGWGKIALNPPVENPRNLLDFELAVKFHKVRIREGRAQTAGLDGMLYPGF